jgi:TP901 family phage tail tape measure protein
MSSPAVIGALRGVLVLDTNDWAPAVTKTRSDLASLKGSFEQLGSALDDMTRKMRIVGISMTAGLTVPLGALAAASNKTAGTFEASMKRVEAALQGVTGKELKQLSDQAKSLGPAVGKGATDAADGIEALGLAGVATSDILGGALKATLDLAAAGMVNVTPAASLVTDVMGQFKATTAELPAVVNDVVGALDASKFGFEDFQLAVAQGGGVAAAAGISFRDFATAVAATSTQFSSGSDAGTSFKTYIQSLVPVSKEAEHAMKLLGIEFFDLKTGRMKPLAEQAEILRKALGNLSDKSKTEALKTIFGSDASRTAIALMEKGRQGILDVQNEIMRGDVGAKIDKRLEGEAAASQRVANAFESVKIAIGEAGLTALITSVKTAFAEMLESIARANPAILKVGVIIGALVAALGPLVAVLGIMAKVVLVRFAKSFGIIGRAISFIVAPAEALLSTLLEFGAARALTSGLGMAARAFLGLTGPIGWAIGAFLLFKDSVVPALQRVWGIATQVLGPPLAALFAQVGAVVGNVVNGPIGTAFGGLMSLLRGVLDVVGTIVAGLIELLGLTLVATINVAVTAISGIVSVIGNVVQAVSALLSGDFAGAWTAAAAAVDAALQTIINVADAVLPGIGGALQAVYESAKAWLVDAFGAVADGFTSLVAGAVNWVASAFPNVTAAAKGVYEGVKGWLVDKFGGLMTWIGNAAKWIGDKYAALKDRLGLGGAKPDQSGGAPAAPAPVAAPRAAAGVGRTVNFDDAGKTKKGAKGRNTQYDADNRQQLQMQAELEAARLRGDHAAEQRMQDQLALSRQIEAYQRTGMSLDQAKIAANRDMNLLQSARTAAVAKELDAERLSVSIEVARLNRDQALVDSLERQEELKRRIAYYYEQTKNLAEATRLAEADQFRMDEARAAVRARWIADDTADRALRLAQDRGDSEAKIKSLQREIDIRTRARELEESRSLDRNAAIAQAATEWDQEDRARMVGNVRATFKDGIRSALDGNIGDWFKNWWRDRIARGMEEAINSLADLVMKLFSNIGRGGSSGGGKGLFGSILGAVGGLFGGGNAIAGSLEAAYSNVGSLAANLKPGLIDVASIPAFNTGGSFKVGGMSGVDANLVSMRLTKGEMVDIRKPGNDNSGTARVLVEPSPYFEAVVDGRAAKVAAPMSVASGMQARSAAGSDAARAARRRIPGR